MILWSCIPSHKVFFRCLSHIRDFAKFTHLFLLSKPLTFLISKNRFTTFLIRIIVIDIATIFFQKADFTIFPFDQRKSIELLFPAIIHFVAEIPLYNRLLVLVKKLFNIPRLNATACVPLNKPMFNSFYSYIFRSPTFNINSIKTKQFLYTFAVFIYPH